MVLVAMRTVLDELVLEKNVPDVGSGAEASSVRKTPVGARHEPGHEETFPAVNVPALDDVADYVGSHLVNDVMEMGALGESIDLVIPTVDYGKGFYFVGSVIDMDVRNHDVFSWAM